MGAVERAQERVDELRALQADIRTARERLPSLRRPTRAVGERGTWTGTAADRLHSNEMVPLTDRLASSLERAAEAVADELEHAQRELRRAREREAAEAPVPL